MENTTITAHEEHHTLWQNIAAGGAALRHRDFRIFFFGQLISFAGTWMQSVAQAWLVYTLTHSAFQLGLVSTFQFAPVLVLSLFAGVVVDRVPKRRLIMVTQSLFLVLALTLGLLDLTGQVQLWQIYGIAVLFGVVNAFDLPARQSYIIEMVGREDLLNAIALNSSTFNAARIFGPALGALLIAQTGTAICFLLNALSFVPVIWGLLLMHADGKPTFQAARRPLRQIAEGVRYITRYERIWLVFAIVSVVNVFGIPLYVTLMPIFADQVLHAGVGGLGVLNAFLGIGALIGAIALAYMRPGPSRSRLLLVASVALGVALAGFGLSRSLGVSAVLLLFVGLAVVSVNSTGNAMIQEATPNELRGRVMSVWGFILVGLTPFGAFFAGTLAHRYSAPLAVVGGALICLVAALLLNLRNHQRHAFFAPVEAPDSPLPTIPAEGIATHEGLSE